VGIIAIIAIVANALLDDAEICMVGLKVGVRIYGEKLVVVVVLIQAKSG
jgi:hypothetical protein